MIYDLVGIRVLVDTERDYAASGSYPFKWQPVRALQGLRGDAEVQHVPVAARRSLVGGKPIELNPYALMTAPLIRHAAHWRYKEARPHDEPAAVSDDGVASSAADWQRKQEPEEFPTRCGTTLAPKGLRLHPG